MANVILRISGIHESSLQEAERAVILRALRDHGGNAEQAADALGIGYSTMYRKIRIHDISDEERRTGR